jgi:hypothetical protein
MLSSNLYTRNFKDPFNKDTAMTYLKETSPRSIKATSKDSPLLPPCSISFESLTSDVGPLEKRGGLIDTRYYNSYLLMPRLAYHLSTKLKGDVVHKHLGQDYEVNLSISSQGMDMLSDLTLIVSFTEPKQGTPT